MMPPHTPHSPPSAPPHTLAAVSALADAMASERALVDELITVLLRQRTAVSQDDLLGVDDTVFAIHRLLLTLGEARKQRHTAGALLGCREGAHLTQIGEVLGGHIPPRLRNEIDRLRESATKLARETDVNQRILNAALANSASLVRILCGAAEPQTPTYSNAGLTSHTPSSAPVFTRTA